MVCVHLQDEPNGVHPIGLIPEEKMSSLSYKVGPYWLQMELYPYNWPYKRVTAVQTLISGVITLLLTSRGQEGLADLELHRLYEKHDNP